MGPSVLERTLRKMHDESQRPEKNHQLIVGRGRSFEEAVFHIENGGLLDDICHPNTLEYPQQEIFIVAIDHYAYLVLSVMGQATKINFSLRSYYE